jgi:hypothetical protein
MIVATCDPYGSVVRLSARGFHCALFVSYRRNSNARGRTLVTLLRAIVSVGSADGLEGVDLTLLDADAPPRG